MPATQVAIGLNKQDFADPAWHTPHNSGVDDANTRLTRTFAGNPNGVLQSHWIGQLCRDTTNNRVYYATNVANPGAWTELTNVLAPFTFGGGVTFAAAPIDFNAQPTLAAGAALSAGQKLVVPAESWLREGAVDMRPHVHASRHADGGADKIPYVPVRIAGQEFTLTTGQSSTISFDFSGSTTARRIKISSSMSANSASTVMTAQLTINGVNVGPGYTASDDAFSSRHAISCVYYQDGTVYTGAAVPIGITITVTAGSVTGFLVVEDYGQV